MDDESDLIIMAGPCSIESEDQLRRIAESVKDAGSSYLRGGAFKPRTEAGQWTGHGEKALEWMRRTGDEFGLDIVTEIMDPRDIPVFRDNGVDLYQVGARNAQNQSLLLALGEAKVPVLLKNGMNTTLKEWLGSAGKAGNKDSVMLCARGKNNEIDVARNGQDITTLVKLVDDTPYRIIFDPSHITGKRELVYGVTMGAVAAGVDGIMVEVHYDPVMSKTDGRQSITPKQLKLLVRSAHEQRNLYLAQAGAREGFAKTTIPRHVDIYFQSDKTVALQTLFDGLDFRHYEDDETTGILTARIPDGHLGKLREHGYAIGKVVKYSAKEDSFAEAVHIIMPHGKKIYMSPFSIDALGFRGKSETLKAPGRGERVELAHGFAGQTIRDAYLTLDMGRVPEPLQKTPLIIYKIMKE